MTPKVVAREVLHCVSGTSDKVYIIEKLERASVSAMFVSWGRRGKALASKHVSTVEAAKLQTEKMLKGYKPKATTIGLDARDEDMSVPMTDRIVYDSALPDTPATTAAPTTVEPPEAKELGLPELEAEFNRILKSGIHAGRVLPSNVSPAGDDFVVTGAKDTYKVRLNPMSCTCPAFTFRTTTDPCKHLVGVIKAHGNAYIRAQERRAFTEAVAADMGVDTTPAAPVTVIPAPEKPLEGNEVVRAIFAPHVRAASEGDDFLVPPMERLEWNVSHARRIAAGYKRRKPVLLYGPTGTGKTSMVRCFAAMTNRPFLRINCTPQTTVADFVGHLEVKDRATVFVPGPLTLSMQFGYILVVDEIDRADPAIGAVLFPAMEDVPTLTLKEDDTKVVEAHPDFAMFVTANSLGLHDEQNVYTGAQAVDAALLSRCGLQIFVDYHDAETETRILVARGIAKKIAAKVVKASEAIRKLIADGRVVGAWGTRHSINLSENALDLGSFEEGFSATAQASFTRDEYRALWEATQRITGTTV